MKSFTYLVFTLGLVWNFSQTKETYAQACCPDFVLRDAVQICPP